MKDFIHFFYPGSKTNIEVDNLLFGGKGAGLIKMTNLGIPVPPGFIISTQLCKFYYKNNKTLPQNFDKQLLDAISKLEKVTDSKFGKNEEIINHDARPLLLSVRSGAPISMPGMMDTILNVGINDDIASIFSKKSPKFAYDSYNIFLRSYIKLVLGDDEVIAETSDVEILKKQATKYKKTINSHYGHDANDAFLCLKNAIITVLDSWMGDRARVYRTLNEIDEDIGTAITVQSMVFGNADANSATGVVFTRCPAIGKRYLFGEFLQCAQGEDIVSGVKTPVAIKEMRDLMPQQFKQLEKICNQLETHFKDMQDIEFTVESSKLYILQTRSGKRSISSALKIAVDMEDEGVITKEQAVKMVNPHDIGKLLHSRVDYSAGSVAPIVSGLAASPGGASGIAVFSASEAEAKAAHHKVILVRRDTSPEDIKAMHLSEGVLTARGGMTSHAAVVARGMGRPCISGANIDIDEKAGSFRVGDFLVKSGDIITIDGENGKVFLGDMPLKPSVIPPQMDILLGWADNISNMDVRVNAETEGDIKTAFRLGAKGIGLCRTEHMYFTEDKINLIRKMIISQQEMDIEEAINSLIPLQIRDFKKIFEIIDDKPINIRLLDPPLHEFLPSGSKEISKLAEILKMPRKDLDARLHYLKETNPMLGHRGCRLGITNPEIYQMQLDAIFASATGRIAAKKDVNLEIMIPFISSPIELARLVEFINVTREKFDSKKQINLQIGTMIELPRAALLAGEIAKLVDYFSFGTNDLTQTCYGISRDDGAHFLPIYISDNIISHDPFVEIDKQGVGKLMEIAIKEAKKSNPKIKLGVCGEHAGNPASIEYFSTIGLDYISCSAYRIPTARLAAACSNIKKSK